MRRTLAYITLAALVMLLAPQLHAQSRLPDIPDFNSFSEIWNFIEDYKKDNQSKEFVSYGAVFMRLKDQISKLEPGTGELKKAGILYHYAKMHEESAKTLEHYLQLNPRGLTSEIAAILVGNYYYIDHLPKGEAFYLLFMNQYSDNTESMNFGIPRKIDGVEHYMFLLYYKHGRYQDAIDLMDQMYARRDKDNPAHYNYSSTLFHLGSKAYMELGKYDKAIEMLKEERAKLPDDSTIGQYADYYRVLVEHRKIIDQTGNYKKAYEYLDSQADLFTNKYAKRKYDTSLAHAAILGKKMVPLTVTDVIQAYPGIDLDNLDGKVVVLDFWATWCHACIEGFPHMNELMAEYEDDGLAIIGITKAQGRIAGMENLAGIKLEYPKELELTKKLVKEYPRYSMDYAVVMDKEGESLEAYGVGFLPTIVVIDRNKVIRWIGHPIGVEFDRMLEGILAE